MRSSFVRFVGIPILAAALLIGVSGIAFAQDATAEATEEGSSSEMLMMEGACPQGIATMVLGQIMLSMEATETPDMDTTESPDMNTTASPDLEVTMEATHDMTATEESSDMTSTEEAAQEAGMSGPNCVVGTFSGAAEVPGPGDEDAAGVALVTFDASTGEVCYDVAVVNITLPANAMHIHAAEEGVSGDVVVPFPTAPDADGSAADCTTAEDTSVLEDLAANPEGYYVNVHTSDFPDGAARAQLMTWDDAIQMMETMGMEMMEGALNGDMSAGATAEATPGS